jgi:hypothetical protein
MSRPRAETQAPSRIARPVLAVRQVHVLMLGVLRSRTRATAASGKPPMMTTTPAASTVFPAVSSTSSTRPVPCVIPVQRRPERYGAASRTYGFALEGRMVL